MIGVGVTQSEITRRVRAKLSEAGARYFTEQNVLDWINEAQDVISSDAPYAVVATWHTVTQRNKPSYLLPTEAVEPTGALLRVSGPRTYRLSFITPDVDNDTRGVSWGPGQPETVSYHLDAEGIAVDLWPAPNGAYDLYVEAFQRPLVLTEATDRTDIPAYLVSTVVKYAVAQAKYKDEEMQQYAAMMQDFQKDLDRLAERRLETQADQHPTVRAYNFMTQGSFPRRPL